MSIAEMRGKMRVELIDYTKNGIEKIARLSASTRKSVTDIQMDEQKANEFVRSLIRMGHEGTLEHIYFTFMIEDVSRVLTHQLIRHRIASYLQQSDRHVEPSPNKFYIPDKIWENMEAYKVFINSLEKSYLSYKELRKLGIKKEDARYLLPPAFYTHIAVTMNAREIRHFLKLRLDKHAQKEIRDVAREIYNIVNDIYPVLVEDIKP